MACRETTQGGTPCQAPEVGGSGFCFHHSPRLARQRHEARRRGGLASQHGTVPDPADPVSLQSVSDVLALLETAAQDTMGRKPSLQRARALCYVVQTALKVLEVGALSDRLEALERTLDAKEAA